MNIRRARRDEAAALTDIAFAAKRHWGYPESWLQRWTEALTLTPEYIQQNLVFVAELAGECGGFCAVQMRTGNDPLLDHLWVRSAFMGRGFGRALFREAEAQARACGMRRLRIVGDPHAERFYLRMGATLYGREPANMDSVERTLPLFEKMLDAETEIRGGAETS